MCTIMQSVKFIPILMFKKMALPNFKSQMAWPDSLALMNACSHFFCMWVKNTSVNISYHSEPTHRAILDQTQTLHPRQRKTKTLGLNISHWGWCHHDWITFYRSSSVDETMCEFLVKLESIFFKAIYKQNKTWNKADFYLFFLALWNKFKNAFWNKLKNAQKE